MNFKNPAYISLIFLINKHFSLEAAEKEIKYYYEFFDEQFKNIEIILVQNNIHSEKIKNNLKKIAKCQITLITLPFEHTSDNAIQAGVDYSIGDIVFEFDSLQNTIPLQTLRDALKGNEEGYDLVILSPTRKLNASTLFYKILEKKLENLHLHLTTETCRLLSRRIINKISENQDKFRYKKIIYKITGYKHKTITYDEKYINQKKFSNNLSLALDVLFTFTNTANQIVLGITMLFLVISLSIGVYSIYSYLTYDKIIEGWTTLSLFISLGFTGVFSVFTIFSKYLHLILQEAKSFPIYTIESVDAE